MKSDGSLLMAVILLFVVVEYTKIYVRLMLVNQTVRRVQVDFSRADSGSSAPRRLSVQFLGNLIQLTNHKPAQLALPFKSTTKRHTKREGGSIGL